MNKNHLPQNLHSRVRLRPQALLIDASGCAIPSRDRTWMVTDVTKTHVELENEGSGHVLRLGLDHLREYKTDFTTDKSGRCGFLMLQCWVLITPAGVGVEPMHPAAVGGSLLQFPARYRLALVRAKQREEQQRAAAQSKAFGDVLVGAGKALLVGAALSALKEPRKRR